ncbi:MAG: hypothetical protein V4773_25245 [Verrucomicrobiota bacterium]
MIVPEFWAEARAHRPRARNQRQVTVRRFGWSDLSQEDAQRMADARVHEAFQRIVAGAELPRLERRVSYNAGVPIREQILKRYADVVVTRNIYGARCLNTPDVLFADVDFKTTIPRPIWIACYVVVFALALAYTVWRGSLRSIPIAFGLAVIAGALLAPLVNKISGLWRDKPEDIARKQIDVFLQSHPDWHVRLYRTPGGFRLLALHALFDPASPEVAEAFTTLGVDPLYAKLCRNQRCFRARLTPKPWRIGIPQIYPSPGSWPVKPEHAAARSDWLRDYGNASAGFASCRFVCDLGSSKVHSKAATISALHDHLADALSGREIA